MSVVRALPTTPLRGTSLWPASPAAPTSAVARMASPVSMDDAGESMRMPMDARPAADSGTPAAGGDATATASMPTTVAAGDAIADTSDTGAVAAVLTVAAVIAGIVASSPALSPPSPWTLLVSQRALSDSNSDTPATTRGGVSRMNSSRTASPVAS